MRRHAPRAKHAPHASAARRAVTREAQPETHAIAAHAARCGAAERDRERATRERCGCASRTRGPPRAARCGGGARERLREGAHHEKRTPSAASYCAQSAAAMARARAAPQAAAPAPGKNAQGGAVSASAVPPSLG